MSNTTWVQWGIYFCIFMIGFIVGRVAAVIQIGLMKPDKLKSKKLQNKKHR